MLNLKKTLSDFLVDMKALGVLGVGSELRSDDVAGMLVSELVEMYLNRKSTKARVQVFHGATAPENLTGEIKKFKPSHLIIVDTAELKKKPGDVMMFDPASVSNFSFSTHKLPIKIMIDFIKQSIDCKVAIIGIQPKSIEFGQTPSMEVKKASENVAAAIEEVIEGR